MVAVVDEQLERERLEIGRGIGIGAEATEDDEQRVDLPEIAELRRGAAGDVLHPDRRRRHLARVDDLRKCVEPDVGDRRDADVRLPVLAAAAPWSTR